VPEGVRSRSRRARSGGASAPCGGARRPGTRGHGAEQVPRRHVRPRVKRPGVAPNRIRLSARMRERVGRDVGPDIVVEDRHLVAVHRRTRVTGIRRPVVASLPRQRDHPGEQNHRSDRDSRADQGGGETGQEPGDEDELGPVPDPRGLGRRSPSASLTACDLHAITTGMLSFSHRSSSWDRQKPVLPGRPDGAPSPQLLTGWS
jgi:hypothetical protein